MGGAYIDHPHCPTKDIISDLKHNLQEWRLDGYVQLITGISRDPKVANIIKNEIGEGEAGLICIDADGQIDQDFEVFGSLLSRLVKNSKSQVS